METAPSNTPILITDGKIITVVEMRLYMGSVWYEAVGLYAHEWEWEFERDELTHWMPLPALPIDNS